MDDIITINDILFIAIPLGIFFFLLFALIGYNNYLQHKIYIKYIDKLNGLS